MPGSCSACSDARRTGQRPHGSDGRLAEGDYTTRVRPYGSPEVRQLATAFNALAERLERDETQRRTLIADVTHELRTPSA